MKPKQSSNASVMQKEHNKTIDCTSFSCGVAVCVCAGMNRNREGGRLQYCIFHWRIRNVLYLSSLMNIEGMVTSLKQLQAHNWLKIGFYCFLSQMTIILKPGAIFSSHMPYTRHAIWFAKKSVKKASIYFPYLYQTIFKSVWALLLSGSNK